MVGIGLHMIPQDLIEALRNPDRAARKLPGNIADYSPGIVHYMDLLLRSACLAVEAENVPAVTTELISHVVYGPSILARTRLGMLSTAFTYITTETAANPSKGEELGLEIVRIVEDHFRFTILAPDATFASLSWHENPDVMAQLNTQTLAEFEISHDPALRLETGTSIMCLLDGLRQYADLHGERQMIRRVEAYAAQHLTNPLSSQLELTVSLICMLLHTGSHHAQLTRVENWLNGDTPDYELSLRRLGAFNTALATLGDYNPDIHTRMALWFANHVQSRYELAAIDETELASRVSTAAAIDLENPQLWAECVG